jgi:uncharacterized protein YndB with AHSA1/START domain
MSGLEAPNASLLHDTFEVERDYAATPRAIFAAYENPDERVQWSAPPGHGIEFRRTSFEIGGTDDYICGPLGDLRYTGTLHYLDIERDSRIVFAERVAEGDTPLAISLVSWTFEPGGKGTRIRVLTQVMSLVGEDMLAGSRGGRSVVMDNLAAHLGEE